jgi:hypothetical protein
MQDKAILHVPLQLAQQFVHPARVGKAPSQAVKRPPARACKLAD